MTESLAKQLCLDLIGADTEQEVQALLADFWDEDNAWRLYGDIENNYATVGNQQSRPEAAVVEKLVNAVDARLLGKCLEHGIDPEAPEAPQTIKDAVARFFDPIVRSDSGRAGLISEWPNTYRTEVAEGITLAATGARSQSGKPCLTIVDNGEGQTPLALPNTILSLHRSNKLRIPFVQGKFNMGGTGALRFCGRHNCQLVVSRRDPKLPEASGRVSDSHWGFTIVRRRTPQGTRSTIYEYLAPLESDTSPNRGNVLHFRADVLDIFPDGRSAYARPASHGTLIKLFEYNFKGRSHILRRDGLLNRLDLLLADVALPIRLHECRSGFAGHEGSFATNMNGFRVRLTDNRADNLEFDPSSSTMTVRGEHMRATIYAFRKGKAEGYRKDEGIIFTINGQTHGHFPTDFFRRKAVRMSYLRDSILVIVDCSRISARAREDLFMNSRDRLADCDLREAIEKELEGLLRGHQGLKNLRERRRREEIDASLGEDRPLEDVLSKLVAKSVVLANLFGQGSRISNPFRPEGVKGGEEPFKGKKFPTYFRFKGLNAGKRLIRECHINKRFRITFETDADGDYFDRNTDAGEFILLRSGPEGIRTKYGDGDRVLNLHDGIANLTVALPDGCKKGDELNFEAMVSDPTQLRPFVNPFSLTVLGEEKNVHGGGGKRKPRGKPGGDDRDVPSNLNLPRIVRVEEKDWGKHRPAFDTETALRIVDSGGGDGRNDEETTVYDYFVNVDNCHVKHYLKTDRGIDQEGAKVVRAQFAYGMVLLGLALVQQDSAADRGEHDGGDETGDGVNIEERVGTISRGVAPVLLAVIRSLGDLVATDLEATD